MVGQLRVGQPGLQAGLQHQAVQQVLIVRAPAPTGEHMPVSGDGCEVALPGAGQGGQGGQAAGRAAQALHGGELAGAAVATGEEGEGELVGLGEGGGEGQEEQGGGEHGRGWGKDNRKEDNRHCSGTETTNILIDVVFVNSILCKSR